MSDERAETRHPDADDVRDERPGAIEELPLGERASRYAAVADELRDVLEGADHGGA
ncbi:hypothetical protein [Agromyces seonyuensis]|uniref:Uncharacterized protein n=1 Tax=Agromyces seonyuensis TaxID=2662446 RepID=A0A6I4P2N1_9MICO|nr:hypothetical protein [Agromyces seonyuensis]MWB99882.1 hypothetical protein [Agromyces seonyuensis]